MDRSPRVSTSSMRVVGVDSSSIMKVFRLLLLSRVELDDELLVEFERHLLPRGLGHHRSGQLGRIDAHPLGNRCRLHRLGGGLEDLSTASTLPDLDLVADLGPEAWNVG